MSEIEAKLNAGLANLHEGQPKPQGKLLAERREEQIITLIETIGAHRDRVHRDKVHSLDPGRYLAIMPRFDNPPEGFPNPIIVDPQIKISKILEREGMVPGEGFYMHSLTDIDAQGESGIKPYTIYTRVHDLGSKYGSYEEQSGTQDRPGDQDAAMTNRLKRTEKEKNSPPKDIISSFVTGGGPFASMHIGEELDIYKASLRELGEKEKPLTFRELLSLFIFKREMFQNKYVLAMGSGLVYNKNLVPAIGYFPGEPPIVNFIDIFDAASRTSLPTKYVDENGGLQKPSNKQRLQ